ncbi:MAG TPA: hypothetical protein VK274_06290, partial [Pyrinomonadaceae bacterium]|nr:hypothetical protein [Pyrinomonadaceae bacterium]
MNQRSAPLSHYFVSKRKGFRLLLMIAFAIVAILPLLVVSSASLSQKSPRSESTERTNKVLVNPPTNAITSAPSSTTVGPLFAWFQGPAPEAIATFAAGCTIPKVSFAVGDVACAKASGTLIGSYKVYWVDSQGAARQTDIVSSTNPTATWTIPESGNWKAYLSTDGLRALAPFQSSDANAPAVDLSVSNSAVISSSSFVSDGIIHYQVWVLNNGPDAATNVSLVQPIPNNTARQTASQ